MQVVRGARVVPSLFQDGPAGALLQIGVSLGHILHPRSLCWWLPHSHKLRAKTSLPPILGLFLRMLSLKPTAFSICREWEQWKEQTKKPWGGKQAGKKGRLAALPVPLERAKCPFPVPACSGANREWAGCCAHGLPPAC